MKRGLSLTNNLFYICNERKCFQCIAHYYMNPNNMLSVIWILRGARGGSLCEFHCNSY